MNRVAVITALKHHETELRKLGILRLSLFGSMARSEASELSDVDIAVTLASGPRGLAHLERMESIKARLGEIVGCAVDVIEEPSPSPHVQHSIEQDRVLAF
jgi:predicted nucleotidyltransferase